MVIVDELPFKFVEKEGFRNLMKVAQPHFKILSRTTVTQKYLDHTTSQQTHIFLKFVSEYVKSLSKDKGSQHSSSLSSSSFENSSSLLSSSGSSVQLIGSLGTFMGALMKHKA
ncbi:hypothetical protein H5410_032227 [Solanum commersonii]|uniref:Uncharacterized protein n=1 Tax=Solanum commersonii TaxID=4109 RepID=A0A9J5YKI1_SOLCO|nr:hypothetical protein H5410_032227 [Solanum commersonii]